MAISPEWFKMRRNRRKNSKTCQKSQKAGKRLQKVPKNAKNVQIRSKAGLNCSNHRLKNTKRASVRGYLEKTKPISYRRERRDRKDKALPFMGRLDTQSPLSR